MTYQPYQNGQNRPQNGALLAMLLGRPFNQPNPMDQWRLLQKRQGLLRYL